MTSSTALTRPCATAPATCHTRCPRTGVQVIMLADPWRDWLKHQAVLLHGRLIVLWDEGGRPVVWAKCGLLGQVGSTGNSTEHCPGCRAVYADELRRAAARSPKPDREAVAA